MIWSYNCIVPNTSTVDTQSIEAWWILQYIMIESHQGTWEKECNKNSNILQFYALAAIYVKFPKWEEW